MYRINAHRSDESISEKSDFYLEKQTRMLFFPINISDTPTYRDLRL